MSKKNTLPRKPIPHNPTPAKPQHRSRLVKFLFPHSEWSSRAARRTPSTDGPQPVVRLASPKGSVPAPGGVKEQHPELVIFATIILIAAAGVIFYLRQIHKENELNEPSNALIYTDGTIDPDAEEAIGSQKRSPEAIRAAAQYNDVQNRMDAPDPEEVH